MERKVCVNCNIEQSNDSFLTSIEKLNRAIFNEV